MVLVMWIGPSYCPAQHLVWQDTIQLFDLGCLADSGTSLASAKIIQQVEYSLALSAALFINWDHDPGTNQVLLLQDIVYRCLAENNRRFRFSQKMVHHLGIQYFFDSITRFQVDNNQFETRLEWRIRNNHSGFLSAILTTRLFNGYDFSVNDKGYLVRTLNSSFLTPFTGLFSGGFQFKWPRFGSLNMGITSAKLTWLRDKGIYEAQQTTLLYGVPSDKKYLFEYGISLQLLIDHEVTRWLHWNCDLLLFKNSDLPPDLSLKNDLGFRLTKFLQARICTRIFYEERISNKVQLENMVSVGFTVTL